jgi:hypothetical protein
MDFYFLKIDFIKNQAHTNICFQRIGASYIFLGLYVDDLIFVSNQVYFLDSIKSPCLENLKFLILK